MSRVALLHNLNRGESERQTEFDSPATVAMLYSIIAERHDCEPVEAAQDMAWIPRLVSYAPDVVFNIAEGYHGTAREAVYPAILEQLGFAYCGPDPTNLVITLNKHLTKHLVVGVPELDIPESYIWDDTVDVRALRQGRYMLKLVHEGSSIGMCLAQTPEEVPALAQGLQARYDDGIMLEAYVDGKDISMAYIEGLGALGPSRVDLPGGDFYDYSLKSTRDAEVGIGTCIVAPELKRRLSALTAGLARRLDLKGYAKIDLRLHDDHVHLIEVNSQVSFHPEGEFAHCCYADGYTLSSVIHTILNTGMQTRRKLSIGVHV